MSHPDRSAGAIGPFKPKRAQLLRPALLNQIECRPVSFLSLARRGYQRVRFIKGDGGQDIFCNAGCFGVASIGQLIGLFD